MKIRKRYDEDTEKFWNVVSLAQEEVKQWPEWKRKIDVYEYVFGNKQNGEEGISLLSEINLRELNNLLNKYEIIFPITSLK